MRTTRAFEEEGVKSSFQMKLIKNGKERATNDVKTYRMIAPASLRSLTT